MAEFCKKCFVEQILTTDEQKKYRNGKIKITESSYDDFCEGCEKIKPIVLEVRDND
ncbi:MAG: hypothetical protein NC299_18020 [Lachnospiraceae bacterium]|nr:hypothetical protein [Ruminococcus sp.]MCM1277225.1 hypothetical protein [Lachnospiraceae bacterium]